MKNLAPVILIVEDEPLVRMLAADAFLEAGFVVLEADCAAEALLFIDKDASVHVLFTDVNMPGDMNGIDLAEHIKLILPNIQLMITSALPIQRPIDFMSALFVAKPYRIDDACRAARELLAA